ncbi:MAG: ATPase, T2SS/T4P/T4SS family [Planctomycetota bacterium]|jgi:excisionase family DNA binding protein
MAKSTGKTGTKARGKSKRKAAGSPGRKASPKPRAGAKAAKAGAGEADTFDELVDMDTAVAMLKTSRPTFYRWLREGRISGMKLGRQWRFEKSELERFLKGEPPRIELTTDISPLVKTLEKIVRGGGRKVPKREGFNEVQQAVRLTILAGLARRATDIHLTAYLPDGSTQAVGALRYRVDGVLHEAAEIDLRLMPAIVAQWKRMAACNVNEAERPQDGRIMINLEGETVASGKEHPLDMRVSFLPAALSETVTIRILDARNIALDLAKIDYTPHDRERLLRAVRAPWGLTVITGPVGCGKTTVLYACLNEVASPGIKTMSVEDPVEYLLPWVTQVPLRPRAGLTYPVAVRQILRADPDVIMIGELRDLETLRMAEQAALTGHLVMTTMHTNDATASLRRMVDMGADPFVIADSTKLIVAQRLVRKLCPDCRTTSKPDANLAEFAGDTARTGGLASGPLPKLYGEREGCAKCSHTGFRRRTVITEMLEMSPEIGKALRAGASADDLREIAVAEGMTTMAADGVRRAAEGETTLREVVRTLGVRLGS